MRLVLAAGVVLVGSALRFDDSTTPILPSTNMEASDLEDAEADLADSSRSDTGAVGVVGNDATGRPILALDSTDRTGCLPTVVTEASVGHPASFKNIRTCVKVELKFKARDK